MRWDHGMITWHTLAFNRDGEEWHESGILSVFDARGQTQKSVRFYWPLTQGFILLPPSKAGYHQTNNSALSFCSQLSQGRGSWGKLVQWPLAWFRPQRATHIASLHCLTCIYCGGVGESLNIPPVSCGGDSSRSFSCLYFLLPEVVCDEVW